MSSGEKGASGSEKTPLANSEERPFVELISSEDRERWLEMRRDFLTASDVPAVMGTSTRSSAILVAAQKSAPPTHEDNEFMAAGRRLEPFIAEWALEEMGKRGSPCGILLGSKEYPWLAATPDWWVWENGTASGFNAPLQIKNTMRSSDWEQGVVPDDVLDQVLTELLVTGAPWGYAAALLTGNRLRWTRIDVDDYYDRTTQIVQSTEEFWDDLSKGREIKPDHSEASKKALKMMHPEDNGETVALSGQLMSMARDLDAMKIHAKNVKRLVDLAENTLKGALGKNSFGTFPDGTGFSFKTQSRKETVQKAAEFRVMRRQGVK